MSAEADSAEGDSFPTQKKCPLRPLRPPPTREVEYFEADEGDEEDELSSPQCARARARQPTKQASKKSLSRRPCEMRSRA